MERILIIAKWNNRKKQSWQYVSMDLYSHIKTHKVWRLSTVRNIDG